MKGIGRTLLGIVALSACSLTAHAQFTQVTLPSLNGSLQNLTEGYLYPVSGPLNVGGVPFTLAADANNNNYWSATPIGGPAPASNVLDISVNVFGVTQAYTLMNSFFGTYGVTIGTIEFKGSGGADATFDLTEGVNIRDHFLGGFNNVIAPGTPSAVFTQNGGGPYNEVHLDRQSFLLPSEFGSQTLTDIIFTGMGGVTQSGIDGEPFLAAATLSASTVPEPGTVALLLGSGITGTAFVLRRLRRR